MDIDKWEKENIGMSEHDSVNCNYNYSLRPKRVDFDSTWSNLRLSIKRILTLEPLDKNTWDHNFYDIYSLCVAIPTPLSDALYRKTRECLEEHVMELQEKIKRVNDDKLLDSYCQLWTVFYRGAICVHNLFGYLNKQYVKAMRSNVGEVTYTSGPQYISESEIKEIGLLALEIWKKNLIEPMEENLVHNVLDAVAADRMGKNKVPSEVVQCVINSFVEVDDIDSLRSKMDKIDPRLVSDHEMYVKFEKKYLKTSESYYMDLSQKLGAELPCSDFMKTVIEHINDEQARSRRFLHQSSFENVKKLCQEVMVDSHKEYLYSVCGGYIEAGQNEDLQNMYRLLKPLNGGLSTIIKEFENFVKTTGLKEIAALGPECTSQQFVESILKVFQRFSAMVSQVFFGDGDFSGALDKALQKVVNNKESQPSKAAEMLARYTDNILRKTAKAMSESEVDRKLSDVIVIFRYVEDKDIFQKFYSRMLSNRLIANSSVSKDAEELMINKLKNACGFEFTSKLTRMFTDVGLSKELSDNFLKHCSLQNILLDVNMSTMILQAGAWPLSSSSNQLPASATNDPNIQVGFIVPAVLLSSMQNFDTFYQASHNGRKLLWLYNLSTAETKLNYSDKVYQVTTSVHQLALLLCFESCNTVTLRYMQQATGLTGELLTRNVRSLVDAELLIASDKENINDESQISLNLNFHSKRIRFKIQSPLMQKQVEKEVEHVNITVQQDRKHFMECAIVRIMKTKKILKHSALVNEIIEVTKSRFTPDMNFIKKNIESLIEKLYIQRTDQNDEYQYMA